MFGFFEGKRERVESIIPSESELRLYVNKSDVEPRSETKPAMAHGYKIQNAETDPYILWGGFPLIGFPEDLKNIVKSCVYEEKFKTNRDIKLGRYEESDGAIRGLLEKKDDEYHISLEGSDVRKMESFRDEIRSGRVKPKFAHGG